MKDLIKRIKSIACVGLSALALNLSGCHIRTAPCGTIIEKYERGPTTEYWEKQGYRYIDRTKSPPLAVDAHGFEDLTNPIYEGTIIDIDGDGKYEIKVPFKNQD